jgi:hypothetical protein
MDAPVWRDEANRKAEIIAHFEMPNRPAGMRGVGAADPAQDSTQRYAGVTSPAIQKIREPHRVSVWFKKVAQDFN